MPRQGIQCRWRCDLGAGDESNSERLQWTFEEVDAKLKNIMVNIFHNLDAAARKYGMAGNYVAGANIAGFAKVADAMEAQGIV